MAILIMFPVKDGGAASLAPEWGGKHSNARTLNRVASSEGSCVNQIQIQWVGQRVLLYDSEQVLILAKYLMKSLD